MRVEGVGDEGWGVEAFAGIARCEAGSLARFDPPASDQGTPTPGWIGHQLLRWRILLWPLLPGWLRVLGVRAAVALP